MGCLQRHLSAAPSADLVFVDPVGNLPGVGPAPIDSARIVLAGLEFDDPLRFHHEHHA